MEKGQNSSFKRNRKGTQQPWTRCAGFYRNYCKQSLMGILLIALSKGGRKSRCSNTQKTSIAKRFFCLPYRDFLNQNSVFRSWVRNNPENQEWLTVGDSWINKFTSKDSTSKIYLEILHRGLHEHDWEPVRESDGKNLRQEHDCESRRSVGNQNARIVTETRLRTLT